MAGTQVCRHSGLQCQEIKPPPMRFLFLARTSLYLCNLYSSIYLCPAHYLNAFSLYGFGKLMSVIITVNVKTIVFSHSFFAVTPLLTRPRGYHCVYMPEQRKPKTFSYWSFLWKPTHLLRHSRWPCVNTGPWPYLTILLTVTSPAPDTLPHRTVETLCVGFSLR